ncbi:hypothetical protein RJD24_01680 [Bacillaceae bacterium IKA-2]|nr:hypothetical protein RJD24_01680 [Bacillaceae bacterium IKA-2]
MVDFKSIIIEKGQNGILEINNQTDYPLIGYGNQGAVFKLSEDRCVKIYRTELHAKMEQDAYKTGQHLPFFPKVYEIGLNYLIMEYFNKPNLKEYLKKSMYMKESMAKQLLDILKTLKQTGYSMIDAPLRHLFVLENEELKLIDLVNAYKREHSIPNKLLRELNLIHLKDSFLSHVKNLEPELYEEWETFFNERDVDFREVTVKARYPGQSVNVDSTLPLPLIGKGRQGAVYKVSEKQCLKLYPKANHAEQEQKVLLSSQNLSFIPKVYETSSTYTLMEYLLGPDLNSLLKKQRDFQRPLPRYLTRQILEMLKTMKAEGFKLIDAPLRHTILTIDGLKLIDHVYSFTREQDRPLELFKDLKLLNYLDEFLAQVKALDPKTYKEWIKYPIPTIQEKLSYTGPHINDESSENIMSPEQIVEEILLKDSTSEINYDERQLIFNDKSTTEEQFHDVDSPILETKNVTDDNPMLSVHFNITKKQKNADPQLKNAMMKNSEQIDQDNFSDHTSLSNENDGQLPECKKQKKKKEKKKKKKK